MVAVQQLVFHMPELIGQIHMYPVGEFQTAGFIPEGVLFLLAEGS